MFTVLLKLSWAVTVKVTKCPAAADDAAETLKCVAGAGATVSAGDAPVMLVKVMSLTLKVWLPVVISVAVNTPEPVVKGRFAGSTTLGLVSEVAKCTVPV